jgi:DNA mismatch repair protein MutS2
MKSRRNTIFPSNFEQKLGIDEIRAKMKSYCHGTPGEERVASFSFETDHHKLQKRFRQISEILFLYDRGEMFDLHGYQDQQKLFEHLKIEGTSVSTDEIVILKNSIEGIYKTFRKLSGIKKDEIVELKRIASKAKIHSYISDRINQILDKKGQIKDSASKDLQNIRISIIQKKQVISKRINELASEAAKNKWIDDQQKPTLINGRYVLPLNTSFKRKLGGIVHDISSTGKTSFIEPGELVEKNNEVREYEILEQNEIKKILFEFSEDIRPYLDDISYTTDLYSFLDALNAVSKFSLEINAICPKISSEPIIDWHQAYHPVLFQKLKYTGRKIVSQNFNLNSSNRIMVISGPNAGGKSVSLKTLGILQYMLQCGFPVPMKSTSQCGIFDQIFIDIGDEQSIENDLSTYSSHLTNMKFMLKNATDKTLFLIDEFGTGTEPHIGGAIAESILGDLDSKKCYGVVTTHYSNLKQFAAGSDTVINACLTFDTNKLEPLYELEIGKPGSSFAYEIARKIGLSEELLKEASEKTGLDSTKFDKLLKEAVRDKKYWQNKRQRIRKTEKRIDTELDALLVKMKSFEKEKKKIIEEAKEEAKRILDGSNKIIEKTIREIKEAEAEKEKTKDIRKKLEQKKESYIADNNKEKKISKEIDKLEQRSISVKKKLEQPIVVKKEYSNDLQPGDWAKIDGSENYIEIIEVNDKSCLVAMGEFYSTLPLKQLKKVTEQEFKNIKKARKQNTQNLQYIYDKKLEFNPNLDLRGKKVEEAMSILERYIDDALIAGIREVKILHGKGYGVLRQLVRKYIKDIEQIEKFEDAPVDLGGDGITVITFRN